MLTRSTLPAVLSYLFVVVLSAPAAIAAPQEKPPTKEARKQQVATPKEKPVTTKPVTTKPATAKPKTPPTAAEKSVKPGINERFLSKKLDVERSKRNFEGESREIFTQRQHIAREVLLKPGMAVADIGAGTGLFLELFAKGVGDKGKLFAVDIAPKFIEYIRKRAKEKGLKQVQAVQCSGTSSELPKASVDVAFVCDTYHHFEFPKSTLASLYAAIKPGGRLVIVDFERIPGVSREFILGHVRIGKKKVIEEVVAAGFRFEDEVKIKGLRENYLIRFTRAERR